MTDDLQRRSRRVRVFWIAAAAVIAIAIGIAMQPSAIEADVARVDRGDVRVEVVDENARRVCHQCAGHRTGAAGDR